MNEHKNRRIKKKIGKGENKQKSAYISNAIAIDKAIDITGVIGDVC